MELAQAVDRYDYSQLDSPPLMELTEKQIEELVEQLEGYHAIYSPYFNTEAQQTHSYNYLLGMLDPAIRRKSIENIALEIIGPEGVRPVQTFIGQSRWEIDPILEVHHSETATLLGNRNGILILDGSDFPKQGEESVGVKRQHCGELGKTANCQAGVFAGYSSIHGYTLLDSRLYIPQEWFSPEFAGKRYRTGMPMSLTFKTKNELAWEMVQNLALSDVLPIRWITMDEAFGRNTKLLDRIADDTPYSYFAEIPTETRLWFTRPLTHIPPYSGRGRRPTNQQLCPGQSSASSVEALVATFLDEDFSLHALKEGSKGLIFAEIAVRRVVASRNSLPGPSVWLIVRRNPSDHSDIKYFLSNAPITTLLDEFATVCALRWPIETMFQQAKQHLGLNQYETRSWLGWYHHMTLAIVAFGFLARCSFWLKQDASAITFPQIVELLSAILPKRTLDTKYILERIRYKQMRIHVAKCSHYRMQKFKILKPLLVTQ